MNQPTCDGPCPMEYVVRGVYRCKKCGYVHIYEHLLCQHPVIVHAQCMDCGAEL